MGERCQVVWSSKNMRIPTGAGLSASTVKNTGALWPVSNKPENEANLRALAVSLGPYILIGLRGPRM